MKPDATVQSASARKVIVVLAALMTVCLVSLIIAGVASLISLAERIHPIAGTIVFWSVCAVAGFFALYCAITYARLPGALVPPEEDSGPKRSWTSLSGGGFSCPQNGEHCVSEHSANAKWSA